MAKRSLLTTWHHNLYSLRQDFASRSTHRSFQPITKPTLALVYIKTPGLHSPRPSVFLCVTQAKPVGAECLYRDGHGWLPLRNLVVTKNNQNKDQEKLYLGNENAATLALSEDENIRLNNHLKHYSPLLFRSDFCMEYACYLIQKVEEEQFFTGKVGQFSLNTKPP